MTEDEKHLDLLSMFHYIVGGITGLFACIPILHVVIGATLLLGLADDASNPEGEQVSMLVGGVFVLIGSLIIVIGWAIAACMIITGRRLKQRRSRTFCMVVAGVECLSMPFGTILGVFTLIVLTKDSVIELFAEEKVNPNS